MKTKILFLVLTLIMAVTGCKTTKQVAKTDIESSTNANIKTQTSDQVNLNINQKTESKQSIDSSKTIVDKGSTVENSIEETEHIKMSVPDQNGNQYITDKIKTKKTTTKGENRNLKVDQEASSKSDHETELRDNSDYKSESVDKSKTKSSDKSRLATTTETKPTRTNTALWVVLILLSVAALIVWRAKPVWFSVAYKWVLKVFRK
ncbi:MAG: hypothetical protein EOM47_01205 [Bacteroidia bacterium]|nr:hypothetical protein [Bacteroidia bacterium]